MSEEGADVAKQERLGSKVSAAYEALHSYITCQVNHLQNHFFKIFIKSYNLVVDSEAGVSKVLHLGCNTQGVTILLRYITSYYSSHFLK